jgi:hypothetical protein
MPDTYILPPLFRSCSCQTLVAIHSNTKLHKFAVIVVAGVVDPGSKQRNQIQHGLLQVSTSAECEGKPILQR